MADGESDLSDLEDVVDEIDELAESCDQVSVAQIRDQIGRRSFGPLLLVFGLIVLSPIGGIPGVPSAFGLVVLLLAGQLLFGGGKFWLPGFIDRRCVSADRLQKALSKIRKPASWVDKLLKPRLTFATEGAAGYPIAVACVILAITLPVLELVPFAALGPAIAISAFGLALIANDGVFAILGYAATVVAIAVPASLFFP